MADKEFEEDDPMELVGTVMDSDEDAIEEMGFTFVEELARMKWPREDILAVFMDPHYRGPHSVYAARGLGYVNALIDSVLGPRPAPLQ
jgi:hypothetical protein